MHGRIFSPVFLCLSLLCGCSEIPAPPSEEQSDPEDPLGQAFDPVTAGSIHGRVVWDGDVPASEKVMVRAIAFNPHLYKNPAHFVMPHVPKVHPATRGVENAVVFLRAVDPRKSRAWDHPAVGVEFHDRQLIVQQGQQTSRVGIVRRGSAIGIVNHDTEYHNLHGRGAGFFAMPLIEANQTHARKLTQAGVVDLSCGAGYYWLHAHLFVVEHPYYARTDAAGRFMLEQVPAGTYDVVCWLPSWRVTRKEVDPETGVIARLAWDAPKEQTVAASVEAGKAREIAYRWSQGGFE